MSNYNYLKKPLINSLTTTFSKAIICTSDYNTLRFTKFGDYLYEGYEIPVLNQNFSNYKSFFKELKKECITPELIFSLNRIKNNITDITEKISKEKKEEEYYSEFPFDYEYVIEFIERYIKFCKTYISKELYEYCFDMQKELFRSKNDTKTRYDKIQKTLTTIYFNEKYKKHDCLFLFGGNDFGIVYIPKQTDVKDFFESELQQEEYRNIEIKTNPTKNIDLVQNSQQNKNISQAKTVLKWTGTQTELIELIKALILTDKVKGKSQKQIIEAFSNFLNIEIKNPDKLIQDIKKRNNGSESLFIDQLKKEIYNLVRN